MSKLWYISFLALFVCACHSNQLNQSQQNAADSLKTLRVDYEQGAAKILFDTIYYDLGELDINGPNQTRDFFFANTGGQPLVITKVESSCPCLEISYPNDSIAPGHKSKITMTLKMNELSSGQFYRSANVYTNASEEPTEIILQGIKNYE